MPSCFERLTERQAKEIVYDGDMLDGWRCGYVFSVQGKLGHETCPGCVHGPYLSWRDHHPYLGPWPALYTVIDCWCWQLEARYDRQVVSWSYGLRPSAQ